MSEPKSFYLAGEWESSLNSILVINPYSGNDLENVCLAERDDVDLAIQQASDSFAFTKRLTSFEKESIFDDIIDQIIRLKEGFISTIIAESGKPRKYATSEVERAIQTFKVAKEECKRIGGETIDVDWTKAGQGKKGTINHFPIGLVAGITPFNFPLNLVAHKVAPALATGCPIIIKPASTTPLTALLLAKVISNTNWPKEAFSVLPCSREVGDQLVTDERVKLLSFTGSPSVGWEMKSKAGKKKVVLELGGNAAAIIDKTASLDLAIEKLFVGAFAYSGQVCIHTQQIFVHSRQIEEFKNRFVALTVKLEHGNPDKSETYFSSMISEKEAIRVEEWVQEAVLTGAKILSGGKRKGSYFEPTILTNTNKEMKVVSEEVFGPVVVLESFDEIEDVISKLNEGKFGLQSALFSNDHAQIKKVYNELDVGALILNDSTTFRTDHMPYGGVKDSGIGREGVKHAMMDMLESRLLVD